MSNPSSVESSVSPLPVDDSPGENAGAFQEAMQLAEKLLRAGQLAPAVEQTERALRLAPSGEHAVRTQEILTMLRETLAAASGESLETPVPAGDDFFGPTELANLEQLIAAYTAEPANPGRRNALAGLQQGLIVFLVDADAAKLENLFHGDFGQVYRALLKSGFNAEVPKPEMSAAVDEFDAALTADEFDLRLLLIRQLCAPAHRGTMTVAPAGVPAWWLEDYLGYVLQAPQVFVLAGEADQYHAHLLRSLREVRRSIEAAPQAPLTLAIAGHFARKVNFIPAYFSTGNLRELAEQRAAIMEFFLKKQGAAIDARLPSRPKDRQRIKVGFINAHFGAQTETHVTLPTLQLDRSQFEVCLFAVGRNAGPVEDYCRAHADSLTVLPAGLAQQVKLLRDAALDVAIIGTNITAVTNQVALIALHRLAPVQLASYCSPISTGMRHIDGYLSGTFTDCAGLQDHFSEKLHFCDGPPGCLDYTVEASAKTGAYDRARLGLAPDDVVFLNAAACFKILPEQQETWARILAAVPRSRLVLLPFNPNWTSAFPVKQFDRTLTEILARHGVDRSRVVLVDSLPTRADVKALESVADVYLDTAPFSGSISVIDPLEIGLPTIIHQGRTHRGRMAAALVRALAIPELITENEADYIALAVKLGTEPAFREQLRQRILAAMAQHPKFVNAPAYAADLGRLLESLVSPDGATRQPAVAAQSPAPDASQAMAMRLRQFFSVDEVVQIDWTPAGAATLVRHGQAGPVAMTGPIDRMADGALETIFSSDSLAGLPAAQLDRWLAELHRVTGRNLWATLPAQVGRNQTWWEKKFIEAGFRKHPLTMRVMPYPEYERDPSRVTLVMEKIPAAALARYPLAAMREERDLHMDMLREAGVRSEAHLARYQLATRYAPKQGVILDAACGLGYGSAMLARQFPGVKVIGIDISEYAIDYARANFASVLPNLEFHVADACELTMVAGNSIDLVVSFETIEHVPDPARFLRGVLDRMKAGARFIGSVPNLWLDETGKDPNPWHFHVFDLPKFYQLISEFMQVAEVYRENAGGHLRNPKAGPDLRQVRLPVTDQLEEAEWWLIAAQKAPALLAAARPKPRVWLVDGDTRGHFYDSLRAAIDAEWLVGRDGMPENLDLAIVSDEWWWKNALAVQELKRLHVPTLHVMDGIIDWKNNWENPRSLQENKGLPLFQPVLGDKIACLGQAQARLLGSWGQAAKCEVVGMPRFDRFYRLQRRTRRPDQPARVLIMTANTPYFNEAQHADIREGLTALRDFFARAAEAGLPVEPVWRVTKGLEGELGVRSNAADFTGRELAEVLTTVDAVVSSSSTAMLEAMLLGLPTALLDFSNVPHYLQPAWQIMAPGQIGPVIGELLNPSAAKLLHQEIVLHDSLECAAPAAPRLAGLVAAMINLGREARAAGQPPVFPAGLVTGALAAPVAPENRFQLARLFPEQGAFRVTNLLELQAELGHWRNWGRQLSAKDRPSPRNLVQMPPAPATPPPQPTVMSA